MDKKLQYLYSLSQVCAFDNALSMAYNTKLEQVAGDKDIQVDQGLRNCGTCKGTLVPGWNSSVRIKFEKNSVNKAGQINPNANRQQRRRYLVYHCQECDHENIKELTIPRRTFEKKFETRASVVSEKPQTVVRSESGKKSSKIKNKDKGKITKGSKKTDKKKFTKILEAKKSAVKPNLSLSSFLQQ